MNLRIDQWILYKSKDSEKKSEEKLVLPQRNVGYFKCTRICLVERDRGRKTFQEIMVANILSLWKTFVSQSRNPQTVTRENAKRFDMQIPCSKNSQQQKENLESSKEIMIHHIQPQNLSKIDSM